MISNKTVLEISFNLGFVKTNKRPIPKITLTINTTKLGIWGVLTPIIISMIRNKIPAKPIQFFLFTF